MATVVIANEAIPPAWQPGVYNGILHLDPNLEENRDTPRGQLIINVAESGVFTGKLFTQGKRLTVRGFFTEDGIAIAAVKIPQQGTAVIFLAPAEGNTLFAVLFGQQQWTGYMAPLALQNPPVKASYTVLLQPATAELPVGWGYGIMRVFPNGVVAVVGKMGDGSKLSWGTTLVSSGGDSFAIPVYHQPVKGGFCGGYFNSSDDGPAFEGTLKWMRPPVAKQTLPYPAGFSGQVFGLMDLYTLPAPGVTPVDFGTDQAGFVELAGPSISSPPEGTVTVQGTRLIPGGELKSFSINKATGLFSGKMRVGTKSVTFKGAVLQSQQFGYGQYLINKTTGQAVFLAEPF